MTARRRSRPRTPGLEGAGPPGRYTMHDQRYRRSLLDARRLRAIDLKLQQFSLRVIGRKLHADPEMHATLDPDKDPYYRTGYPGGYGWRNYRLGKPPLDGHALVEAVSVDLAEQLRTGRIANEAVRQEALTLKLEQLEAACTAAWPGVMRGNARDHEVWLRNMEVQIRLLGLEPSDVVEHHHSIEGGGAVHPVYNAEYATRMFDALKIVGAIPEGATPPPDLLNVQDDTETVDAEVVPE